VIAEKRRALRRFFRRLMQKDSIEEELVWNCWKNKTIKRRTYLLTKQALAYQEKMMEATQIAPRHQFKPTLRTGIQCEKQSAIIVVDLRGYNEGKACQFI